MNENADPYLREIMTRDYREIAKYKKKKLK
jgi:hypothetical protein